MPSLYCTRAKYYPGLDVTVHLAFYLVWVLHVKSMYKISILYMDFTCNSLTRTKYNARALSNVTPDPNQNDKDPKHWIEI